MKKNKFGFTLIELLAVVLIIGILTAIALPQYRKSTQRAEAMEALVNLKSIFESAKRYKSANSEAPTKLNGLDVSFYDADTENASTFNMGKFTYKFDGDYISACRNNDACCFKMYYTYPPLGKFGKDLGKDVLTCIGTPDTKYGWICEAMGYDKLDGNEYNMSKENK